MSLDRELNAFMEQALRRSPQRSRNVQLIADYYGLAGQWLPTLDELAVRYGVGTRERVRQIKEQFFLSKSPLLRSAPDVAELLMSAAPRSASWVLDELRKKALIGSGWSAGGLLRLLKDLHLCGQVGLYAWDLKSPTRASAAEAGALFFAPTDLIVRLRKEAHVIRHAPGKVGIARFEDAAAAADVAAAHTGFHRSLIEAAPGSWTYATDKGRYYLFERSLGGASGARNPLITALQKIRAITPIVRVSELVDAIQRSLRAVAEPDLLGYPRDDVVEYYVNNSRFLRCRADMAMFQDDAYAAELKPSEVAAKECIERNGGRGLEFRVLEHHLAGAYNSATVGKLRNSPIFCITKDPDATRQTFALIGGGAAYPDGSPEEERRLDFQERLQRLCADGTDQDAEGYRRREQSLFREWLFREAATAECAICGRCFPVDALRAAHKRRREFCSEAERADLDIVMPLCVFGCDHLYDAGYVVIQGGIVTEDRAHQNHGAMATYLAPIIGRAIGPQWREPAKYFAVGE